MTATERTAHLRGGPRDGETVKGPVLGYELRLPDDKAGGVYVFGGPVSPIKTQDFVYRWEARRGR